MKLWSLIGKYTGEKILYNKKKYTYEKKIHKDKNKKSKVNIVR